MGSERWNSNLHAFDRLLESIPAGARRGLDIGCGEGETARRLRARVPHVTGLDPDEPSVDVARSIGGDIDYVVGSVFDVALPAEGYDVVTAVAVLHHVDPAAALQRMAGLLRPGGMLMVVGLARSRALSDRARDLVDAVAIRRYTLRRRVWHTSAPMVWPPLLSYAQTRDACLDALPGADFRRVQFFRYALTWVAPGGA